ncbi:hypothetical protein [Actinospongicola halichondriae]|uniref:hypothetical protein n=1 Tax=Actinospongicola halichondriae TaxID=3236844 RepID=UPI003D414248
MKWAFTDESWRKSTYLVATVVIETGAMSAARSEVTAYLRGNQRRIHMNKESDGRRRQFLDLIESLELEAIAVVGTTAGTSMPDARRPLIAETAGDLADRGVANWLIESVNHVQDGLDRESIANRLSLLDQRPRIQYDHRPAHTEPLLWVADGLAWAVARGRRAPIEVRKLP